MTPRVQALLAYFYQIATDPRVKAAGTAGDLLKFRDAVLACVAEDLPAVRDVVLRGAVDRAGPAVKAAARRVVDPLISGPGTPQVARHAAGVMDALIDDGLAWVGRKVDNLANKSRR